MAYFECSKYDRENYILDIRDRIDQKVIKNLMGHYGEARYRAQNLGKDYEEVRDKSNHICSYLEHKRF